MKRIIALIFALLAATMPALADGFIIVDPGHWHPAPPPPTERWRPAPRPYAPLEITYHHVNVRIDGQVATTTVDQEFYNPNSQTLEGTYLFPVPKGATIDKFSMEIGGRQVQAELLSADKARAIYEDIVRRLKDPALMEYASRDVFKVRVYPIEPLGHKRISLSYSQVLTADSGLIGYTYPLNTEKFSAAPLKNVSVKVELNSREPLKNIYSPSHTVEIKREGPRRATVSYEASDIRPDTDFTLYFAPESRDLGISLLTSKPTDDSGYFLLLASPGEDLKDNQIVAKDVVFVLDTSGSMAGRKLEQAKRALRFCIESLNDQDRFEVIRFSSDVDTLFGAPADVTRENRTRALDYVTSLKALGGTAIDEALKRALGLRASNTDKDRPLVVVFLTDGQPTVGLTDENGIVGHAKDLSGGRIRVFCFGIGTDVNTHLLDKIGEETHGACQYVLPEEDLEVKVSSFFSKINQPVLSHPTVTFRGDIRVEKLHPSPLPDLFKGEQLLVVGRYTGRGEGTVVIEGTVNGEHKTFTRKVNFSGDESDAAFLPRLWATRRIGYLLDEIRLHGENAELRDEVTALARQYGIVTPYTAYLIAEDEARRDVPLSRQSMPLLNSDGGVHAAAAGNWNSFKEERSGDKALAGARFGNTLKSANAPDVAMQTMTVEANRGLGIPDSASAATSLADDSKVRLAQSSQQSRYVQGKNFFQNNNQWVDGAIQQLQKTNRVRVQFNSPEYFALAKREPLALPWMALGQNVQFVLRNTVYEIYE